MVAPILLIFLRIKDHSVCIFSNGVFVLLCFCSKIVAQQLDGGMAGFGGDIAGLPPGCATASLVTIKRSLSPVANSTGSNVAINYFRCCIEFKRKYAALGITLDRPIRTCKVGI